MTEPVGHSDDPGRRSLPEWSYMNKVWRVPLWKRVKLALSVLRGRQWWGEGWPTPWAYEQVCETLRKERERHGR